MAKLFEDKRISGQVTLRTRETATGKSIYLDVYQDGVRSREFLKLYLIPVKKPEDKITNKTTWESAETIARERAQQIVKGKAGIKDKKCKILLLDFMQYRVEHFMEKAKEDNRKGNNTAKQIRNATRHLAAYINLKYGKKAIKLSDVDKKFCVGYGEYLYTATGRKNKYCPEKPLSSGTREIYYKSLSTALNVAVKMGYIQQNPMTQINRQEIIGKCTPNERVYLTIEELQKLISTKCKREDVRNAFLFSCMCGLRWSDINAIKWGNIHTDGDTWQLEIRMEKTRELLYLPLSDEARNFMPLKGNKTDTDYIFSLPKLYWSDIIIAKWVEDAGIAKHISFHCARHTFATLMLTQGADLYTTSKLLGHKNIATTQIYAKIIDEKKSQAVNLLNGIFNAK